MFIIPNFVIAVLFRSDVGENKKPAYLIAILLLMHN